MSSSTIRSVSSCSSYSVCGSDPSSSTCRLFAHTSTSFTSPLGSLQYASPEATSSIIARLVPKSALAKKIQKARKAAEKEEEEEEHREKRAEQTLAQKEEMPLSRRERIQAKFLAEEKQWKRDALIDTDARIAGQMKALGL